MREIKFRAWHKPSKRMFRVDTLCHTETAHFITAMVYDSILDAKVNVEYPFHLIEIMQYTGLKDKNGKEIYEGDIIKRHKNEVFNIEFERGQFGVYIGIEGFIPGWRSLDKFVTDFKVLGNIYENPELLKGG